MDTYPSLSSVVNIPFIMVWKMARELVRPKNITLGLKSPWLVTNATFHSSPSLIWMLLYPHLTSNLENRVVPLTQLISSGMRGRG